MSVGVGGADGTLVSYPLRLLAVHWRKLGLGPLCPAEANIRDLGKATPPVAFPLSPARNRVG